MAKPREIHELISSIMADSEAAEGQANMASYFQSYRTLEQVENWLAYFATLLKQVPHLRGSTGLDFGCWYGFSSLFMSQCGPAWVFGSDIKREFAEFAEKWRTKCKVPGVSFMTGRPGSVPVQSSSMDWVVVNQVFCNMNPDHAQDSIAEIARVLRPGGRLLLSDSNNPYCEGALERLRQSFRKYEIGEGTAEAPDGSLFRKRVQIISQLAPSIAVDEVRRLARETAYLWGDQLERAVLAFCRTGKTPLSVFVDSPLVATRAPDSGGSQGNITDPFVLCREFKRHRIGCQITCNPGTIPTNRELYSQLTASQGFYLIGTKDKETT